jgi:hypothetical protein
MVSDGVGRGWEGLIWYWEGSGRVGKGWEGYMDQKGMESVEMG